MDSFLGKGSQNQDMGPGVERKAHFEKQRSRAGTHKLFLKRASSSSRPASRLPCNRPTQSGENADTGST